MKLSWQIFWHALLWLIFIAICLLFAHNNTRLSTADLIVVFVVYGIININLFYLNFIVLMPNFLDKKRYGVYAVSIIVSIICFGFIKYGVALIFKEYVLMRMKAHMVGFGS